MITPRPTYDDDEEDYHDIGYDQYITPKDNEHEFDGGSFCRVSADEHAQKMKNGFDENDEHEFNGGTMVRTGNGCGKKID